MSLGETRALQETLRLLDELIPFAPRAVEARLEQMVGHPRYVVPQRRAIARLLEQVRAKGRATFPAGARCAFPVVTDGWSWLEGALLHAVVSPISGAGACAASDAFAGEQRMLALLRGHFEVPAWVVPGPHLISRRICELVGDSGGAALALAQEAARRGSQLPRDVVVSAAIDAGPDGRLALRPVSGCDRKRRVLERELPGCRFFFVTEPGERVEPSDIIELIPLEEGPFAALADLLLPRAQEPMEELARQIQDAEALFANQRYGEAKERWERVLQALVLRMGLRGHAHETEGLAYVGSELHGGPELLESLGVESLDDVSLFLADDVAVVAASGGVPPPPRQREQELLEDLDRWRLTALSRLGAIELHAGHPARAEGIFEEAAALMARAPGDTDSLMDEVRVQIAGVHIDRFRPDEAEAILAPIVVDWRRRLNADSGGLERRMMLIAGLGCTRRLLLLRGVAEQAAQVQQELLLWSPSSELARSLADLGECWRRAASFDRAGEALHQARGALGRIPLETYHLQTEAFLAFYEGRLALDTGSPGPSHPYLDSLRRRLPQRSAAHWRLSQLDRLLRLRAGDPLALDELLEQPELEESEFSRWHACLGLLRAARLAAADGALLRRAAAAGLEALGSCTGSYPALDQARIRFVESIRSRQEPDAAEAILLRLSAY